ncbi:methyltransferase domain-containing protein [Azospirillum sp. sgz301742]
MSEPGGKAPAPVAAPVPEADLRRAVDAAGLLAQEGDAASLSQALTVLDAALEACDTYLPGLILRSRLRAGAKDLVGAIKDAAAAVATAPADAEANGLLSEHMLTVGRVDEATMFAYEALKAAPDDPVRFVKLAGILYGQGAYEAAEELFGAAGTLAPDDAEIVLSRMDCLMRLNRDEDAIRFGEAALLRFKDDVHILRNLGNAFRLSGRKAEAAGAFERILLRAPDDGYARHMLATLNGSAPDTADPDYVKAVFDGASASFEESMMNGLQCRIPGLIAKATDRHVPGSGLAVLDIGCGTGLCGVVLRERASFLKGVDLSPGMVEIARGKDLYDELDVAEIIASLSADPRRFDLIVAGDVMPYFGNTEPLMHAVKARLKPQGYCVFSMELCPQGGPFRLNASGRFAHSRDEVRRVATACGFGILQMDEEHLRLQDGKPVSGLVVVLQSLNG